MAVGLDLDTESLQRTSIPGGGAGTLSDGGFKNCFAGVWLYRPSSTATYALTAAGGIVHFQAGAREVVLWFNSVGVALSDLSLQIIFNSGGGAGTPATFAGHTGASFLDEWVYYFIADNPTDGQIAGYIRLADLATAVTQTRANDNAGSQFVNTLTFGNTSGNNAVVLGRYAFARAAYDAVDGFNVTDALAFAASGAPIAGDWGFWALSNNTDNADTSGNSRALTFNGTLTSESDPSLAGPPPTVTANPVSQRVKAGATASFTAAATSADSQQWQSNATGSWVDISGQTSTTYTTGSLAAGLAYAVRCGFTNTNGTTYTQPADVWTPSTSNRRRPGNPNVIGLKPTYGVQVMVPGSMDGVDLLDAAFFDAPAVAGGAAVTNAGGIASAEAFGTATLTRTSVKAVSAAGGIASAEAFGIATVTTRRAVSTAGGVASAEAFGTPTLTRVTSSAVVPTGIASAEAFGTPTLTRTSRQTVSPAGIASAEAFGSPTLSRLSLQIVVPSGIASAEAFGTATFTRRTGAVVSPAGIVSAEAFGTAVVTRRTGIAGTGIASAEAFGTPVVTARRAISVAGGIASAEAFGNATFSVNGTPPTATRRWSRVGINISLGL